jgi:phage terminase large subunit
MTDRSEEIILDGPAGTGKTRGLLEKVHLILLNHPGAKALMVRKTLAALKGAALQTYQRQVLHPADRVTFYGGNAVEPPQFRYPNRSRLYMGGMDDPGKVMSSEYDVIYVNEATELNLGEWEQLTTRLRNGVVPYQQQLGDCNPDAPAHWAKRRAESGRLRLRQSRHEDNPALWDAERGDWTAAGRAYIAKLDALTGVRHLRLRKGIWAAAEGMVYDGWDRAIHVVPRFEVTDDNPNGDPPRAWPRYLSVDFGYTNPFCCQWWAEDPDGRLWRYREIYMTQRLVEDHAETIKAVGLDGVRAIVCDHDAEDRATLARKLGRPTLAAYKAVAPGIQATAARLKPAGDGRPRLLFLADSLVEKDPELADAGRPTCTEDEVESYVWDTRAGLKKGDQPVKRDDHGCLIAGTLVETASGNVPIERVLAGMLVRTRRGYRRVVAAGLSARLATVLTVTLSDGRTLTGTGNHPVFVAGAEWTALDTLRYNDVLCESNTDIAAPSRRRHTTRGAGCANVATTRRTGPIRGTGRVGSRSATVGDGASSASWRTWASGQQARRSTALTAQATTSRVIVAGPRRLNRRRIVRDSTPWPTLRLSARSRRRGTPVRKGAPGTPSMLASLVLVPIPSGPKPVSSAALPSRRGRLALRGSARTVARQGRATRAESITSSGLVRRAVSTSRSIGTNGPAIAPARVLSVSDAGRADVYNLTVDGEPEYFANGVLVHNCDATRYLTAFMDDLALDPERPEGSEIYEERVAISPY